MFRSVTNEIRSIHRVGILGTNHLNFNFAKIGKIGLYVVTNPNLLICIKLQTISLLLHLDNFSKQILLFIVYACSTVNF